jgi:hypothetical protein
MDSPFIVTKTHTELPIITTRLKKWTLNNGGTCHIYVAHFGLQFTFHRKSGIRNYGHSELLMQANTI